MEILEDNFNSNEVESKNTDFRFLKELQADHPELADKLKAKIPNWIAATNKYLGIEGYAEKMLDKMDYVSKEEEDRTIKEWSSEVEEKLTKNKSREVTFITVSGGSNVYFAEQVYNSLPENLRTRVKTINRIESAGWDFINNLDNRNATRDYYYFDDGANSGQQIGHFLIGSVFSTLPGFLAEELNNNPIRHFTDKLKGEKYKLNIKLFRLTDIARDEANLIWTNAVLNDKRNTQSRNFFEINIQENKMMPTTLDVNKDLNLSWRIGDGPNGIALSASQRVPPILGIMWHKIQDNLPAIMSKCWFKDPGTLPLFEKDDIKTPYQRKTSSSLSGVNY